MAQTATRTTKDAKEAKPAKSRRSATTIREAAFELFRARGMTTMFGNPGSTELPMLADFPSDFKYVLGLQEAVAVGMADGFAQASGQVTHVNLHTAPGVRKAVKWNSPFYGIEGRGWFLAFHVFTRVLEE